MFGLRRLIRKIRYRRRWGRLAAAATVAADTATADLDRLKGDKRFTVSSRGLEANAFNNTLEFNTRRKELSDVRVRRALTMAVNRDFISQRLWFGIGKPAFCASRAVLRWSGCSGPTSCALYIRKTILSENQ